MNKKELISAVAEKTGATQKDAGEMLDAIMEVITAELSKNSKVQFVGFGTFQTSRRAARTGWNPQTGEEVKIAASTVPVFRAGKALRDAVNK